MSPPKKLYTQVYDYNIVANDINLGFAYLNNAL